MSEAFAREEHPTLKEVRDKVMPSHHELENRYQMSCSI
jgi:hypothetical protein